jgi:hypothetical protein
MTDRRSEADLFPHQRAMLEFLLENKRVAWWAEPGTGKTGPALTAIARFMAMNPNGRVLIASFRGVVRHVPEREARKWTHLEGLKFHRLWETEGQEACKSGAPGVYLANWERLPWVIENAPHMRGFQFVWFDESSALKHRTSRRAKHSMAIASKAAVCLTTDGAPRSGGIHELWTQLQITKPKCLGSYREFEETYCYVNEAGKVVDKPGASEALAKRLEDIAIVFRAADVTDVPEELYVERYVDVPAEVNDHIDKLSAELATYVSGEGIIKAKAALAVVMKIEQLMCGRALSGTPDDAVRHVINVHDEKLDAIERLVNELNGEPLLIACKFKAMANAIVERIPGAVIATSDNIGVLMPEWKAGRIPALIANTKALGHGVDGLQDGGAHHVCFVTQVWSGSERQQFIARLKRSGQKSTVTVHDILVAGIPAVKRDGEEYIRESLDQIIHARVSGNIASETNMLEHMAATIRDQFNSGVNS